VLAVIKHLAVYAHAGHQVVHAVERLEEGALAAAGGAYEGGYLVCGYLYGNILQGVIVAVIEVQRPAFYYGFVAHFDPPCYQRFLSFLPASFAAMLMTKAMTRSTTATAKALSKSARSLA